MNSVHVLGQTLMVVGASGGNSMWKRVLSTPAASKQREKEGLRSRHDLQRHSPNGPAPSTRSYLLKFSPLSIREPTLGGMC